MHASMALHHTLCAVQGRSKLQSVVLAAFIFDSMPSRALLGYSDVGLPENVAWQAGMSRPVLITRTLAWLKTPEEQDYFAQHVFPICMAHFLRTTPSVVTCLAQPSEPLTTAQFVLPFIHVLGEKLEACMNFAALFGLLIRCTILFD